MMHARTLSFVVGVVIAATWADANDVEAQSAIEEISRTEDAARFDRIALGHLAASQLTLAEDAARRAIEASTDYAPAYNTLGLVQLRSGDPASARDSFVRARELDPTLFAAHMNEGALALDVRDFEGAHAAFLHAIELRPRDYDAWISLGVVRRGLDDVTGARTAYEQARSIDESRPEAHFDLGILFQLHGDGSTDTLAQGVSHLLSFYLRAQRRPEFASAVDAVMRQCTFGWHGRGFQPPGCHGLIDGTPHEIVFTLEFTREMRAWAAQMLVEMERAQAHTSEQQHE